MTLQASGSHEKSEAAEKAAELSSLRMGADASPQTVKNKSRQLALTAEG